MATSSLRDHLIHELTDLLSAEQQLVDALPKMADAATTPQLRTAFRGHLNQTKGQAKRLEQSLKLLGERAKSHTCKAMKGLLDEGEELMESGEPGALRDAMLITAAQKVEHYEIASYGTVRTYADLLGERGVVRLMDQTLKEEKAADKKLTGIAEQSVNRRASKEWHDAEGMITKSAKWIGATVGSAVSRLAPGSASDRQRPNRKRRAKRAGRKK